MLLGEGVNNKHIMEVSLLMGLLEEPVLQVLNGAKR